MTSALHPLPLKPEVCVLEGRLAVFIGGAYKLLDLAMADRFGRAYQSELAKLRRHHKRARRAAAKAVRA